MKINMKIFKSEFQFSMFPALFSIMKINFIIAVVI